MTAGQLMQEVAGTLPPQFYVTVQVTHTRYTTHPQIELEWSVYAACYNDHDKLVDNIRVTAPSVEQVYHRWHAELLPWAKALMEVKDETAVSV